MDLASYLQEHQDSFNKDAKGLYDRLANAGATIDFAIRDQDTWGMQEHTTKGKYTIIDPGKGDSPAGMIHELQHIQLAEQGFKNDTFIQTHFAEMGSFFGSFFGGSLVFALNNKIAHIRMIGPFKAMGFTADSFLQSIPERDFSNRIKPELDCMRKLKEYGMLDSSRAVLNFIDHSASAKLYALYPKEGISTDIAQSLRKIDEALYDKLERIYDRWLILDSVDNLPFYVELQELLDEYDVPATYQPFPPSDIESAICNEMVGRADENVNE